ncbi:hypothetical protein pb186bvf_007938 [Paramecium bursaria]
MRFFFLQKVLNFIVQNLKQNVDQNDLQFLKSFISAYSGLSLQESQMFNI